MSADESAPQVHEAWTPDGEPQQTAPPVSGEQKGVSEDAVIEACASVYDPEIPVNIYELGLIYAIEIDDDGAVRVEMSLTAPGCPAAQELPEQVRGAVLALPGVTRCDVDVVWDPPWNPSRMSEEARLAVNMF